MRFTWIAVFGAIVVSALSAESADAENLGDAWSIALRVNGELQSQQSQAVAAGWNAAAARSARYPTVRTFSFESFLTATPSFKVPVATSATGGAAAGVAGTPGFPGTFPGGVPAAQASSLLAGIPSTFPILGPGQRQLPVSLTFATVPLFTSGRIRNTIEAANAQVGVQRTEEFRTALDLKLTVADAYIAVLRATKNRDVARSNVDRLASFARDIANRREQGLAIRSDELAADVSLANAQIGLIQAQTALDEAWATYNRYLCRPLATVVPLEELSNVDPRADWEQLAAQAVRPTGVNETEVQLFTERALRSRPELAGLVEQSRGYSAQAQATKAGVKPQAMFVMGYAFIGNDAQTPQGIGSASFLVDWTITDSGATRRRAKALEQQSIAARKRRADLAAEVVLQVRNRWLDLRRERMRVPVAGFAIKQAEENMNVVVDRYRQKLSTYTEVLDAENRRVQSLTNYYNALYDESVAMFRLRRVVGDL